MEIGNIFDQIKQGVKATDPVAFLESNFTLDGNQFRLTGNGFKPFADIYRYIGIKALSKNSKPIILVKGRQVGGTTMATMIELYFMTCGLFGFNGRPPIRILHAFPSLIHVGTFTKTKLTPVIRTSKQIEDTSKKKYVSFVESKIDKNDPSSDSLTYKKFLGENFIRIESTGLDADRLRGGTADVIFYDECQDTPVEAIANANKLLTTAKYGPQGIQVYFGTPKQAGTNYHQMWMKSTQQYYHLGCEECGEHFPLYTPNSNEWESIWIYGHIVRCPHCGHTQDKIQAAERGKWVATRPEEECQYIGFHINQFYIPSFTRESIEKEKPENSAINTERTWQNEVLGEFYNGDAAPLTKQDIRDNCAENKRSMVAGIPAELGKKVFAGFDWGRKTDISDGGQSYTVGVVLTEEGPGLLAIQFATKFLKNDMTHKKSLTHEIMRKYSVTMAVGDIGDAQDLMEELQLELGADRFKASRMTSKVNNHIKYDEQIHPTTILAEREFYIEELINVIKRGMIKFPYGNYDQIGWLEEHCTSMEQKTTFNSVKEPIRRYVKGSTPNDGFMALLNAYIAYKYYLTNGFKEMTNSVYKPEKKSGFVAPVLAYAPGLRACK